MTVAEAARELMEHYPKIFFTCHRRHVRDKSTQAVLSAHQASILDHLDEIEPTSLSRLAMHMGVTASTMSLSIDRLERLGYVTRQRDPDDGRKVGLRLTDHGVRLKESQSVLEPEIVRSMLARLAPDTRRDALRGLAVLAAAAQEEMHQRGSARPWRASRARH